MRRRLAVLLAPLAALAILTPSAGATVSLGPGQSLGVNPGAFTVGDVDGKNGPDIVYASGTSVTTLLNKGNGTFATGPTSSATVPGGATCGSIDQIALTDYGSGVNAAKTDGKLDVVLECPSFSGFAEMTGDGTGAFAHMSTGYSGAYYVAKGFALAQMTSAGSPPELIQHGDPGYQANPRTPGLCGLYLFNLMSRFCAEGAFGGTYTSNAGAIAAANLLPETDQTGRDLDEVVTLAGSDPKKTTIGIYVLTTFADPAPGSNDHWTPVLRDAGATANTEPGFYDIALGDLQNDGDNDIVLAHYENTGAARAPSISYLLNQTKQDPKGSAFPLASTLSLSSLPDLEAARIADIDGDGCNDILAFARSGMLAHLGTPNGTLDAGHPLSVPITPFTRPVIADLDRDGKPDVVVITANTLTTFRNTSTVTGICKTVKPPPTKQPVITPPVIHPISPLKGLKGLPGSATPSATGSVGVGRATNPPTVSTSQQLVQTIKPKKGKKKAHGAEVAKARTVVIASGKTKIPKGKTRKLAVKLTKAGRKLLKAQAKVTLTLVVTARGTTGKPLTKRTRLVLHRPKPKKHRKPKRH